jgi:hypothetical protein
MKTQAELDQAVRVALGALIEARKVARKAGELYAQPDSPSWAFGAKEAADLRLQRCQMALAREARRHARSAGPGSRA